MFEKHNKKLFNKVKQPLAKRHFKAAKFEEFLKCANFFYRSIGIEPYEIEQQHKKRKSFAQYLLFYFSFINLNTFVSAMSTSVVLSFKQRTSFIEATYALSYVGFCTMANCKMLYVWLQKPALTKFVNGMKKIFPEHKRLQREYNLQKYLKECSFITLSFSWLYMILIWTYNLMAIVKYIICDRLLGMQGIEQDLPYIAYIPWDWKQHWSYYILSIFQNMAGYTSAAGQISSDLFLISCTTQLIMHFDYLNRKITNYACDRRYRQKDMKFLKASAAYHANLLNLCDQLNQVFGVPLLLNFAASAFLICFVGFQITIGASPETMIKLILFFISSTAEAYLICHFGQQLLEVSTSVANAVYNQKWYLADVRFQKMLILVAQRAQKPALLKAPAYVHASFDTLSELMQISYKFFAVLRTMYPNN